MDLRMKMSYCSIPSFAVTSLATEIFSKLVSTFIRDFTTNQNVHSIDV